MLLLIRTSLGAGSSRAPTIWEYSLHGRTVGHKTALTSTAGCFAEGRPTSRLCIPPTFTSGRPTSRLWIAPTFTSDFAPFRRTGRQISVRTVQQNPGISIAMEGKLKGKTVLVAFGGNALLTRGEQPAPENQMKHAAEAAAAVGRLVREEGMKACITYGNGPQVGLLALQAPDISLDVLGAESQGQIGYLLEKAISAELPGEQVAVLVTQTTVDPADPAFQNPTKFIGPLYTKDDADKLAKEKGFVVKPDGRKGFRRVVASPQPLEIIETRAIEALLRDGFITICTGGGGIPVVKAEQSGGAAKRGVEAVIDKDAASSVLAIQLCVDFFLILTDAPAVLDPVKWPAESVAVPSPITPARLSQLGSFASGSMGPKVQAACWFVEQTKKPAGIGAIGDAVEILRGQKGTLIVPA